MASSGRTASFTIVALTLGFVCGAWTVGTGLIYRFIPAPKVEQLNPHYEPLVRPPPPSPEFSVHEIGDGPMSVGEAEDHPELRPSPGCDWVVLPSPLRLDKQLWMSSPNRSLIS